MGNYYYNETVCIFCKNKGFFPIRLEIAGNKLIVSKSFLADMNLFHDITEIRLDLYGLNRVIFLLKRNGQKSFEKMKHCRIASTSLFGIK